MEKIVDLLWVQTPLKIIKIEKRYNYG